MKKPNITPKNWIVNDGLLQQQDLIDSLIIDLQEPSRHWTAVGTEDKDGYAESVAYCHPINAQAIAAVPKLLKALEAAQACFDNLYEIQQWNKALGDEISEAMDARDGIRAALLASGYTDN